MAVCCSLLLCVAVLTLSLIHSLTHARTHTHRIASSATHCNTLLSHKTLQHTATHCSLTLTHTHTRNCSICNTLYHTALQRTATLLSHTDTHTHTHTHRIALPCHGHPPGEQEREQRVAACCSVLQRVAVRIHTNNIASASRTIPKPTACAKYRIVICCNM